MVQTFGKKKLVRDISANTIQTGVSQVFGLFVFYVASKYLPKSDFGEYNWSMAIGATVIALASLGMDVVFVRRLASGQDAVVVSGIHFFHTVIVGVIITATVYLAQLIFPALATNHPLFFLVFVNLSLINIANSFRLGLMGLEAYRYLAILAIVINAVKIAVIVFLFVTGPFTIYHLIYTYVIGSCLEFMLGYYFVGKSISAQIRPLLRVEEYKYFILESLPQLGVVFFDSALARIDWILLGLIGTISETADYSFSYRMYEVSKLPLLVIAPILLTRFTKMFTDPDLIDDRNRHEIGSFFKLELFFVTLIPVVLVCTWTPVMDYFTNNKYGAVNDLKYMLLAACVPLHCIINFLWSMGFAQGQLKRIMYITVIVAVLNLVANCILIPLFAGEGAAVAFLVSTLVQTVLYFYMIRQDHIRLNVRVCAICFVNAIISIAIARTFIPNVILSTIAAVGINLVIALVTRQVDFREIRRIIRG